MFDQHPEGLPCCVTPVLLLYGMVQLACLLRSSVTSNVFSLQLCMTHPLTKWLFRRFRLPDFSRLCWNKTKSCPELVMTMQYMDYAEIFVTPFQFSDIWQNMPKIG